MASYDIGDTVLIKYKGQKYEAKILKIKEDGETPQKKQIVKYFVHYLGWNSRWDRWADAKEVVRLIDKIKKSKGVESKGESTDEKNTPSRRSRRKSGSLGDANTTPPKRARTSIQKSKEESNEIGQSKQTGSSQKKKDELKKVHEQSKSGISTRGRTKKSDLDENKCSIVADKDPLPKSTSDGRMKMKMSLALKTQLAEEWERFSEPSPELCTLPRDPTVTSILKQFVDSRKQDVTSASFEEFAQGLKEFFDKALPLRLLYSAEMDQYKDYFKQNENSAKPPSEVYGAEHFLRLFVLLGDSLHASLISKKEKKEVHEKITGLLQFLDKHQDDFFAQELQEGNKNSVDIPA